MSHAQHANPNHAHHAADTTLRRQLVQAIRGGEAHLDASHVFSGIAREHWGARVAGAPHTLWQLLQHTRLTVKDLYVFSTDSAYKAPKWPDDYWPREDAPETPAAVRDALGELETAIGAMVGLVEDPAVDLCEKIPWGDGQTILREALLAATHNSYHLGQAMFLRKQLER